MPFHFVNDKMTVATAGNQMKKSTPSNGMPIIRLSTTTSRRDNVRTPRRRRLRATGEERSEEVAETISCPSAGEHLLCLRLEALQLRRNFIRAVEEAVDHVGDSVVGELGVGVAVEELRNVLGRADDL